VGIEQVQGVHEKNSISSSEIREVSEEDTYRVVEYSDKLSKVCLSRRLPGGHQISLLI
jgi:hypothetical protein